MDKSATKHRSSSGCRRGLSLLVATLLLLAISRVPAGVGTHGRTLTSSGGGSFGASFNPDISITPPAGTTGGQVRDMIVAGINATATGFQAAPVTDPDDPLAAAFEVRRTNGQDVRRLAVCEDDPNFQNIGVHFGNGRSQAFISMPAAVAGDGIFRLQVKLSGDPAWNLDQTFDTSLFANDPNGLIGAVTASLGSKGFTTQVLSEQNCGDFGSGSPGTGCLLITRTGGTLAAARIEVTDSGMTRNCVSLVNPLQQAQGSIPTLSQYGMFLLVLLLTVAAIGLLRRKMAQVR